MQACTTTTVQAYRVPVTTYRQVCRDVVVPVAPVAPAVPQFGVAPSAGCSSCGVQHAAAPAFVAPQPQAYVAPQTAPTYATPTPQLGPVITPIPGPANQLPTTTPGTTGGQSGADQIPTLPTTPTPQSQIPQSQYNNSSLRSTEVYPQRVPTPDLRPLPDLERTNERAAPQLLSPNPNDRTAQRDLIPAGAIAPIAWATQRTAAPVAVAPAASSNSGGWRPSR
jgi:hypothetical protein